MNHNRNNIYIAIFAALAAGISLALTLLQFLLHLPAVIGSVSWNL